MVIPVRYPRKRPAAPETSPQKPEKPVLIEPLPPRIQPIYTYGRGPHLTRVWNDASLLTKGQLSDARFLNALLLSGERGMKGDFDTGDHKIKWSDFNLSRISARNFALTDACWYVINGNEAASCFFTKGSAYSYAFFGFDLWGTQTWGSGSAPRDTNLYRKAANILATDDDFEITVATKGVRLKDRTTGTIYRLYVDNGVLGIEAV